MITQIKRRGSSLVIVLPSEFSKYMDFKENDWVDISDINKVDQK